MNYEKKINSADYWKCKIPAGEFGTAKLEDFEASGVHLAIANIKGARLKPGNYKRLLINGDLVMSDTPKERRDHFPLFDNAKGHVLINGLGMGCALNVLFHKPEVESITVIENNQDVIYLIGPHFPYVRVINDCAFEWRPPKNKVFDTVWHDIWPSISADNWDGMKKLHRKYGRHSKWQDSWCRYEVKRLVNEHKRHDIYY